VSGISNVSVNYERQLSQLSTDVTTIEAELKKLENDNQSVVTTYNNAKKKVEDTLAWVRTFGNTDMQGNPLKFNTLQEFHELCGKGGIKDASGKPHNNGNGFQYTSPPIAQILSDFKAAEANYNRVMGPTLGKLTDAQRSLDIVGGGLKESIASLKAMAKLLESGDIEGAVMLLQQTRAKGLDQQLGFRIQALQDRNAQIKSLNDDMVRLQKEKNDIVGTGTDETKKRGDKDTDIATLKGNIDKLNSDSQIDMIGIQGLVNKRNEAFDMLTNLLGKFQKTIDGIVGNMR